MGTALRRGVSTGQLRLSNEVSPVTAGSSYYTRVALLQSRSPSVKNLSQHKKSTSPLAASPSPNDAKSPPDFLRGSPASDSSSPGLPGPASPPVRSPSRTYLQRIRDSSSSRSPATSPLPMGGRVEVGARGVAVEDWVMRGAPSYVDVAAIIGWKPGSRLFTPIVLPSVQMSQMTMTRMALERCQTQSVLEGLRGRRSEGWASRALDQKPLLLAAKEGRLDDVAALLEGGGEGSDVFTRDKDGMTALHHACWSGKLEVTKLLLDYGGRDLLMARDRTGNTVLHYAAWKDRLETVKFLCERGGEELIVAVDSRGKSCLDVSRTLRLFNVVDFLFATGFFPS